MSTRIKVGVRVRPLLENEKKSGYKNSRISLDKQKREILVSSPEENGLNVRRFQFDHVFGETTSQVDVFEQCEVGKMVDHLLDGYHSTIFAYGQTGSGKTHTMQGFQYEIKDDKPRAKAEQSSQRYGIVPRTVHNLFAKIKQRSTLRQYTVSISFLQIYNEKIFDLLNPSSLQFKQSTNLTTPNPDTAVPVGGLRLRWNQRDQFTVQNLFIFQCKSAEEVIEFYKFGIKNRVIASHRLNMASSRSHTIMTIKVESIDLQNPDGFYSSKLELVDLAGSERIGQTGTEGQLAKESIDINKSLFILRQVISTLAEANQNGSSGKPQQNFVHIPYRESKLTSLLKQSIGGNSYCLMIACITPCDFFVDENLSTLNYATKATYIQNDPVKNDDPRNKLIAQLRSQILKLQSELDKANAHISLITQLSGGGTGENGLKFDKSVRYETAVGGDPGGLAKRQLSLGNQTEEGGKSSSQKSTSSQSSGRNGTPLKSTGINARGNYPAGETNGVGTTMNLGLDYEQFSDRLIESIKMVRELLQSNQQLRESTELAKRKAEGVQRQFSGLQTQNQELRDKLMQFQMIGGGYSSNIPNRSESPVHNKRSSDYSPVHAITQDEKDASNNSPLSLIENRGNLISSAGNQSEVMIDYQKMTPNELISEILNLRRDKKQIERKLKSQELERSRSINMSNGKSDNSVATNGSKHLSQTHHGQVLSMNGTPSNNQNLNIMPLKEVENTANGVDSLPTNFGRQTFYQSLNGSMAHQMHHHPQYYYPHQVVGQNHISCLENDVSQEIPIGHITVATGAGTLKDYSTVSPKALLGNNNLQSGGGTTYTGGNQLNNTSINNYYKKPNYTPNRKIQMPAIDDNIQIGEITRYSVNTVQARSNSLNQPNGMYNQNIIIAPQSGQSTGTSFGNNSGIKQNNQTNPYGNSYY